MSDNIEMTDPEVQDGKVVGDSTVKSEVSSEELAKGADGESVSAEIADMSPEEYKLEYAKSIAERYENMNGGMSESMIQKIADNVVINGNYPDNFTAAFDGTVVRGNIYLTPDELNAWKGFVNPDDPFASNGTLGKDTTEWLKNNVEGVEEQLAAEEAEQAARQARLKARYDAMSAEEQKAFDQERQAKYGDFMDVSPPGTPKYESVNVEELWDALDAYELREAPAIGAALAGAAKGIGKAASKTADVVGKAAAKGASKAGAAAKSVGNELGNVVTTKKLIRMWNKAGKPTDMGSIVNILNQAGISDEQIGTVGKQARIPLEKPKSANSKDTTSTSQVDPKLQALADEIKKLGLAELIKPELADG